MRTGATPLLVATAVLLQGCSPYMPFLHFSDIQGWEPRGTRESAALERQCDVLAEGHLRSAKGAANTIAVLINNRSGRDLEADLPKTQLMIDSNSTFAPAANPEKVPILAGETRWFSEFFPVSSASQFAAARSITVTVPLIQTNKPDEAACPVALHFTRAAPGTTAPAPSTSRFKAEFGIEAASSLVRSGNLGNIGTLPVGISLDIAGYSGSNGAFFQVLYEGQGSPNPSALPAASVPGVSYGIDGGYFALGYTHRFDLGELWSLRYDIGPAIYVTDYGPTPDLNGTTAVLFTVAQRASLFYSLARFALGEIGLVASVYDAWIPHGSLGTAPADGNSLGVTAGLRMGFL